jgi:hypothetical protein
MWQRDPARAENREIVGVLERGAGLITGDVARIVLNDDGRLVIRRDLF